MCAPVQALRQNAASVPYGESCLTRLLADSMGQDRSRAVLIATCRCTSPWPSHYRRRAQSTVWGKEELAKSSRALFKGSGALKQGNRPGRQQTCL